MRASSTEDGIVSMEDSIHIERTSVTYYALKGNRK